MNKVALVTGANQGLGFALVKGLCNMFEEGDTIYLTARNRDRGEAAAAKIGTTVPTLLFERMDVTDDDNVAVVADTIRRRHGGIDVVISNAAARISKDVPPGRQVRMFIDTNNHGTTRMLAHFMPILNKNARFVTVASSFGSLSNLPAHLHARFDFKTATLEDIDAVMDQYVSAVEAGEEKQEGWPGWINIPSKVGQVVSTRIAARMMEAERLGDGILINAACPGLVDTDASRPWFDDMSKAQSPDDAAKDVLWLATLPAGETTPQGELVQFRTIVP